MTMAQRGRPAARKDGEARMKVIGVRVTDEEETLIVDATPPGLAPSSWLRQIALAAAAEFHAARKRKR